MRWIVPVAGLLLTLAVIAVFHPVRDYEFVNYDEKKQLIDNPLAQSLSPGNIARIFSSFCITSYYPVRLLSLAIDHHFWKLNPRGYHLTNLAIHLGSSLLLMLLILRLWEACGKQLAGKDSKPTSKEGQRWTVRQVCGAAGAAAIFALHPLVVEPVAWVGCREEILMLFFVLLGVHAFMSSPMAPIPPLPRRGVWSPQIWGVLCVLFVVCACLSNVMAAASAFILTAFGMIFSNPAEPPDTDRPALRYLLRKFYLSFRSSWPFWVIALAAIVVKKIGDPLRVSQVWQVVDEPPMSLLLRMATVFRLFALDLKQVLWPRNLTFLYPPFAKGDAMTTVLLFAGIVLAGVIGVLLWRLWQSRARDRGQASGISARVILFGIVWFLAGVLPSVQLIPHHIYRGDRFFYLPLPGAAIAVSGIVYFILGGGAAQVGRRDRQAKGGWVLVPLLCIVLLLAGNSARQLRIWRNGVTLFEHCVKLNPTANGTHFNLGNAFSDEGRFPEALQCFQRSFALAPTRPDVNYNLANTLQRMGRSAEALEWYDKALAVTPDNPDVLLNHGIALHEVGKHAAAAEQFAKANTLRPGHALTYYNRGNALAALGRTGEAIEHFRESVRLDPGNTKAHFNLAVLLLQTGQVHEGQQQLREALRLAEAEGNTALASKIRTALPR
jgi:Flp pilus assembly protein TadD